jgi:hypothetical protein
LGWTTQDLNPARDRIFLLSKNPDWPWGPPIFLFSGYWDSVLGLKQPGHKVKHLLLRLMSGVLPLLPICDVMVVTGTALIFDEFV